MPATGRRTPSPLITGSWSARPGCGGHEVTARPWRRDLRCTPRRRCRLGAVLPLEACWSLPPSRLRCDGAAPWCRSGRSGRAVWLWSSVSAGATPWRPPWRSVVSLLSAAGVSAVSSPLRRRERRRSVPAFQPTLLQFSRWSCPPFLPPVRWRSLSRGGGLLLFRGCGAAVSAVSPLWSRVLTGPPCLASIAAMISLAHPAGARDPEVGRQTLQLRELQRGQPGTSERLRTALTRSASGGAASPTSTLTRSCPAYRPPRPGGVQWCRSPSPSP